jgi:tetratricopeptide (TPR) repeat protein
MNTKEKVLIHKGMDKVNQGQYREAIEIFDRVLSTNPKSTYAWNNRGVALFKADRPEEALDSYDQSLKIDPENLDASRNKGFVLRSMGRMQEALECYELVIKIGGNARDMESLATVLVGMDRLDEAMDCMLQAISMEPTELFEEEVAALKMMIEQRDQGT